MCIQIQDGNADDIKCVQCEHDIDKEYLEEQLDTDPVTNDNYFDHVQKNCAHCCSLGSVVPHHDFYICTECRTIETEIGYCEWCNEAQIGGGDLEFSYHSGCEFCDGHAEWTKDD